MSCAPVAGIDKGFLRSFNSLTKLLGRLAVPTESELRKIEIEACVIDAVLELDALLICFVIALSGIMHDDLGLPVCFEVFVHVVFRFDANVRRFDAYARRFDTYVRVLQIGW